VHVFRYGPDDLQEENIEKVDELRDMLGSSPVVWINVDGLGDATTIKNLGEIFGLHALALEDVVNVHQRAKVEEYCEHLFIVVRMVSRPEHLESEQISMFLGKGFVLTFQEHPGNCLDPVRQRLRMGRGRLRTAGADYLAYSLLDAIVDCYFPLVDDYGEQLELLDERITANYAPQLMHELHDVRGDLMFLRRAIRPLRDALVKLMPDPMSLISAETQFFMRDCYDHTIQLMDLLDTFREMCSDLRDFYLTTISNRMNEIMKVLTIIATIFIPLSFIAGVYGMNFDNMPELHWSLGYPFALAIMSAVAIGLLIYFKNQKWIGGSNDVQSKKHDEE